MSRPLPWHHQLPPALVEAADDLVSFGVLPERWYDALIEDERGFAPAADAELARLSDVAVRIEDFHRCLTALRGPAIGAPQAPGEGA